MDISELVDFIEPEEIMAFTEAFLAWEQETVGKGRKEGRKEEKRRKRVDRFFSQKQSRPIIISPLIPF